MPIRLTSLLPARLQMRAVLRAEDWFIAGWVAVASPLIFRVSGDKGPFDPAQPLEGVLRLAAVIGVLACLAARHRVSEGAGPPSLINRGAVGPLTGGLLLVTISAFVALGTPQPAVLAVLAGTVILLVAIRVAVPPLDVAVRRILVSPFVLVAGGLYWGAIEAVVGTAGFNAARSQAALDPRAALVALSFLIAFSSIYYAMLIYAPRQIAEREGGVIEWVLRYLAFVVSVVLGIGWLGVVGA